MQAKQPPLQCPKCNSRMVRGHVLEHGDANFLWKLSWIAGEPEKSMGCNITPPGRERYVINAYRCSNCAFVEFYANEPNYES
jgi:predicted nucleic-acid-binding Zn-ribbon protein